MNKNLKLRWTRDEIEAEHPYSSAHVELDIELHGGFDEAGQYLSPRTLYRVDAVNNWRAALETRGFQLIDADISLLKEESYPNPAQQKLLLGHGLGQTLFNSLTNIGRTEARGALIAQLPVPDFQEIIVEPILESTLGHLDKGLFAAHGWDEGGKPGSGKGAHDQMWFIARDLLWPRGTYAIPEPAAAGSGGGAPERRFPRIPQAHERVLNLMMDVLMIELKAYRSFAFNEDVMRDPGMFAERRKEAARSWSRVPVTCLSIRYSTTWKSSRRFVTALRFMCSVLS